MSKRTLIIGGIVVIVALAAIGASMAPKNAPAGTIATQIPGASAVPQTGGTSAIPTAAAPSASAPAVGGYKVGDRIKLGDEEFFAISQVDPAFKSSDLIKPAAGNKWVAVLIEIEGIDPNGASYNPFYFKIKDEQGFEYNFSIFGKEPQLKSSNDLKPGEQVKGWVTFEVPISVKALVVTYTPGLFGDPVDVKVL